MGTMKITVRDVMSSQVVAVRRGPTFKEMAAPLREYRISGFPVIDEAGKVIGVVSEADLLAKGAQAGGHALHHREYEKAEGLVAGDLMTHPTVTVGPDDAVEHAARMMYSLQVKRLPVVDAGGFLVGIVSLADLLAVFDRPDEEILAEIADVVFAGRFGLDPALVRVPVTHGVVILEGHPEPAHVGDELADAIRHVRGVVTVRDELGYPPAENSFVPGLYF
jgi:CBS-domain-containing membrane protein